MAEEMGAHFDKVAQKTGIEPPKPGYIPDGFELDSYGVHNCDDPGQPYLAALTRYSDGINVLTIFAMKPLDKVSPTSASSADGANRSRTPASKEAATSKEAAKGGTESQACNFGPGTMLMRDTKIGRLLAVADLPPGILRRVLDSTDVRLVAQR